MQNINTRYTTIVIGLLILMGLVAWGFKPSAQPIANLQKSNPSAQNPPTTEMDDTGVISVGTNGQNIYTNALFGLKFAYPQGWSINDNHLVNGTLQFFSKINKIEGGVQKNNTYGTSTDYPEKTRTMEQIALKTGQMTTREDIELVGGDKIRVYFIPVPSQPEEFFGISIYGDPSNFFLLDNLVQSVSWSK